MEVGGWKFRGTQGKGIKQSPEVLLTALSWFRVLLSVPLPHLSSGNNVLINNVLINNVLLRNLVRSVQACILGFRNGAVFSLLLLFLIVARGSTSSLPLHAVFSRERE